MRTIRNLTMTVDNARLNLSDENFEAIICVSLDVGDGRRGSMLLTYEEAAALARAITLYFNEAT